MKIKTYRSDSVPRALEQIKKDLGPNAVILDTKKTTGRRFLGLMPSLSYEITAASDQSAAAPGKTPTLPVPAEKKGLETYEVATTPPQTTGKDARPGNAGALASDFHRKVENLEAMLPRLEKIGSEIENLKRLVSSRKPIFSPALPLLRNEVFHKQFDWKESVLLAEGLQALLAQGVEETLAFALIRIATRDLPEENQARAELRRRLNELIQSMVEVSPLDEKTTRTQTAVFIGPTGVGKTTTIAKLAARFALKEQKKVRLITLDTYRIAAAEQLKTFGEIIGVPVHVVFSVDELREALGQAGDHDLTLIDTTGHSHKKVSDFEELSSFLRASAHIQKHLVLSATTKADDVCEVAEGFRVFGLDRLVVTKLDETSTFGIVLNELIRMGKPLSYLTNGQKVPENLIVPTSRTVADLLAPLTEEHENT